ncbi:hypothetical protein ACFOWX_03330 [Sphingorhabdus arenilitoris]|uniref:Uncharacterized protein n=1 Tax=Sphingorhabdus arenilitoris TaxID=1490041 RepID=A0ABV8RES5_9SPHN
MAWNGRTAEVVAVGFCTNQTNTRFIIPDDFEYDTDVFGLPNLRGYNIGSYTNRRSCEARQHAANDHQYCDMRKTAA